MLKRLLQVSLFGFTAVMVIAWWRYRHIRKSRIPAPKASRLVRNPDTTISIRHHSDTLSIEWTQPSKRADIYLVPASQAIDRSQVTATVENQQFALLHGINANTRYRTEVILDDGTILSQIERTIPLKSVPNFRDIGGYDTQDGRTIKWNRVYRSSALDNLSQEDSQQLQDLGIRLICDVRTIEEHLSAPDKVPDSMEFSNLPPASDDSVWLALFRLLFQADFLENLLLDLYQRVMIDNNLQIFASIFQRLGDDANLPMLIHCAAGKDRTGISIALLLAFLDVADETIIADYSLSNQHYDFFKQTMHKNLAQLRIMGLTESDFDYLLIADGRVMQQTLDYVRAKYGSIEHYLLSYVGISADTLTAIRDNLLND